MEGGTSGLVGNRLQQSDIECHHRLQSVLTVHGPPSPPRSALYTSVSQPSGPAINDTGPREVLLEVVILVF